MFYLPGRMEALSAPGAPMTRWKFDLHLHTTASDGLLSPGEVAERARDAGLMAIAVTDHDTTDGVESAKERGDALGLPVIAGVELSADFGTELHILGYGMDIGSPAWRAFASEQKHRRAERNMRMLERIDALGLKLPEEFLPESVPGEYGRMHMALGLVAAGHAEDVEQAFRRYLGRGAPAYVKRRKFGAGELIGAVKASGGSAVLAHPGRMERTLGEVRRLAFELKEEGLEGIEAFYPSHEREEALFYAKAAFEAGLVCTYGSDWHGFDKDGLAYGFDSFAIPDETYDWLDGLIRKGGTG